MMSATEETEADMSMPSPKYTPEFKRHAVELYRSTEGATYAQRALTKTQGMRQ